MKNPFKADFYAAISGICFLLPTAVYAQSEAPPQSEQSAPAPTDEAPPKASEPAGVTIDMGYATIYNFRGVNVFGDVQSEHNMLFAPSIAYALSDTGLSISYWGAYQINGSNKADKVAVGAGHEEDLILSYSKSWLDNTLTFGAAFAAYLYPFARESVAGTACPTYLEPAVSLSYASFLNFGLQVTYFIGVQEEIKAYRYLYIRPTISKSFELTKKVTQLIAMGYGYKLFNDRDEMKSNVHDIAFDLETMIKVTDSFYVKPAFRGGWTNLEDRPVGEEYLLYASVNVGFSI